MVYVEARLIRKKKYYYIVKNIRVGQNKWKKKRKYFGVKSPTEKELVDLSAEFIQSRKIKYLTKEQLEILEKIKIRYRDYLKKLTPHDLIQFEDATVTSFTYNTSAIEGSTLSLQETGAILHKGITPAGKDLREVYGATNMREAYNNLKKICDLTEQNIKNIHKIVMNRILSEELGEYRTVPVRVIGSRLVPPLPFDVGIKMKNLFEWYQKNRNLHPFELACLFHIKFEKIHPFRDGNGRTGRLAMNFILIKHGYQLLDIKVVRKIEYYKCLESAQVGKKYKNFISYALSTYIDDAKKMGWV